MFDNLNKLLETSGSSVTKYDPLLESSTIIAIANFEHDLFNESAFDVAKNVGGEILTWLKKLFIKLDELLKKMISQIDSNGFLVKKRFNDAMKKNPLKDDKGSIPISLSVSSKFDGFLDADINAPTIRGLIEKKSKDYSEQISSIKEQILVDWVNLAVPGITMNNMAGKGQWHLNLANTGESVEMKLTDAKKYVSRAERAVKELEKLKEVQKTAKSGFAEYEKQIKSLKGDSSRMAAFRVQSVTFTTALPAIIRFKQNVLNKMVNDGIKVLNQYK